jgi:hypothetical protein
MLGRTDKRLPQGLYPTFLQWNSAPTMTSTLLLTRHTSQSLIITGRAAFWILLTNRYRTPLRQPLNLLLSTLASSTPSHSHPDITSRPRRDLSAYKRKVCVLKWPRTAVLMGFKFTQVIVLRHLSNFDAIIACFLGDFAHYIHRPATADIVHRTLHNMIGPTSTHRATAKGLDSFNHISKVCNAGSSFLKASISAP